MESVIGAGYGVFLLLAAHLLKMYGERTYGPASGANRYLHGDSAGSAQDPYHRWAWPHSEAARFTIGIALTLCVLAVFVPGALLIRSGTVASLIAFVAIAAISCVTAVRLLRLFREGAEPL